MPGSERIVSHAVVDPQWIDSNGHMNYAYYVVVFDRASDLLLDTLGCGVAYRSATGHSLYVVETHVSYRQEVKAGDPLQVICWLADADDKRLHLFLDMRHGATGAPVATSEVLCLHVDQKGDAPRALPFRLPLQQAARDMVMNHRAEVEDVTLGRSIGLKAGLRHRVGAV